VGRLCPVLNNFLQICLTLNDQHIDDPYVPDVGVLLEVGIQNFSAILDGGSETVVLDHVGDVAVPGLVEAEDSSFRVFGS